MLLAITPPNATPKVVQHYNALLGAGLSMLLLRLPDATQEQYEDCIRAIEPRHRSKVILADYFHLGGFISRPPDKKSGSIGKR